MAKSWGGWAAILGSNYEAIALYRISLGIMLLIELVSRFQYLHPFYSDSGTLPLNILLPKSDSLYKAVCIHCYSGSMIYLQLLLSLQVVLAVMLVVGHKTKLASIASWVLYLSLTLRNTWLNFILDRYFHYLLFYSMFLPLDGAHAIDAKKYKYDHRKTFISPGTIALKVLITWLYWDAGYGKYSDPLQGWTLNAKPLPALDTYVRHTVVARIMYGLLGPSGLRLMTPTVVYAEMFCAPVALLGSLVGSKRIVYATIIGMCSIHIGIAFTMRNTVLLSSVACVAWCIFLPSGVGTDVGFSSESKHDKKVKLQQHGASTWAKRHGLSTLIIAAFACGSVWFEMFSDQCNQSHKHIWSTLLHNRWNVFVGAEEYVTWEIAPGQLADGSIVDVWSKSDEVNWNMPGAGAPCTSTARAGRWRSYPYLAELEGEDGEVLWSYLCRQWDEENRVHEAGNEGKKLLKFNFFMLQADVKPNMGFSATRKRLIHSHDCLSKSNFVEEDDGNETFDFAKGEEL
mmetsp:Transcript_5295/g.7723  ORF Transcript_5295/g.7723 Transcript_5295/m.7723 type:complete len:513 (-) Transcript_5295:73-1611(-)